MTMYDQRDPNALFTGFGLNEPEPEPDEDDIDDPDLALENDSKDNAQLSALADENGLSVDQLEDYWAQFRGRQVYVNLANVAVAIAYCVGVRAALKAISLHLAAKDGPAQFTVMYQPAIWWGVAGFGGFILAWEITILVWSLFTSKRTIRLYREWVRRESFEYSGGGFRNQLRLWHWAAALFVLPITVAGILALNMHCLVRQTDMRVCGFAFKPCKVLSYEDIRHVEFYPAYGRGRGRVDSKVVVDFGGGEKWDSGEWVEGDVDLALAYFFMAKDSSRVSPDLPAN